VILSRGCAPFLSRAGAGESGPQEGGSNSWRPSCAAAAVKRLHSPGTRQSPILHVRVIVPAKATSVGASHPLRRRSRRRSKLPSPLPRLRRAAGGPSYPRADPARASGGETRDRPLLYRVRLLSEVRQEGLLFSPSRSSFLGNRVMGLDAVLDVNPLRP